MGLKLQSSSGGSVELVVPVTASAFTATVPAQNCTLGIQGPAFSAYQSAAQSLSAQTTTKLTINTEEYDTNDNYNTTNYRFTPTVAGYYLVCGGLYATTTQREMIVYKNGSNYRYLSGLNTNNAGSASGSTVVYLNGTTDYIELYGYFLSGGAVSTGQALTFFQATLLRAA